MITEGFSCSLDVLYGGLEINDLQLLIKKGKNKLELYFFSSVFCHQNPGSGLDPESLEMLDPDPDQDSINPDPQLCCEADPVRCLWRCVGRVGGYLVFL